MPKYVPSIITNALDRLPDKYRRGVFSLGWSGLSQVLGIGIKLVSTLVLTRLLAPEAYGILGTAMAVLTTLEWLSDLGIYPALIRHPKGDQRDFLLTGWIMGLGRGTLLSVSAGLAAWPLASFYDEPQLLGVLLVLAARPLLFAIRSPALPTLRRELNYRSIFIDEIAQAVIGTACSIAMAFLFRSVWAIVLGTMAGAVTSVVLSYFLAPMRPGWAWNREAVKGIYDLGHQVFVNTLIMAAWLNLDRLLGLKLLSPTDMGLYAIAFNLSAAMEGLVTKMCDVYFSMLARETDEGARHQWHVQVTTQITRWGMPLGALAVVAGPLVIQVLYDPRYESAGIIFSIMIGRLMVRTIGQMQFQYLLALAQVRLVRVPRGGTRTSSAVLPAGQQSGSCRHGTCRTDLDRCADTNAVHPVATAGWNGDAIVSLGIDLGFGRNRLCDIGLWWAGHQQQHATGRLVDGGSRIADPYRRLSRHRG